MPSFDVVSEVDQHELTNAIDQTRREVDTRFDFKGSAAGVERSDDAITVRGDTEFQLNQVRDILYQRIAKRGVDVAALKAEEVEMSGSQARQRILVRQGIDADTAKRIVRLIKDSKMRVQASVQGDKVRVTGKKRDDLQQAIALLKDAELELPLQYNNFRD